ncbi:hypothetical protein CAEBREN_02846 [Caenorhabditis brenneri]|uniref:Uncharacterized protein n=1 Tax=Caenorhabditis brenneri TaxID=135651 RepID=G0MQW1_CAEBE|nr:hypothetical protein CAEBREN_02846 [Caenorhabditis brenneri]
MVQELCEKLSKLVAAVKEHQEEVKRAANPPPPEEIEMEVFWRKTYVRFTEPEEKWSITRRKIPPTRPINIIYPTREQDW